MLPKALIRLRYLFCVCASVRVWVSIRVLPTVLFLYRDPRQAIALLLWYKRTRRAKTHRREAPAPTARCPPRMWQHRGMYCKPITCHVWALASVPAFGYPSLFLILFLVLGTHIQSHFRACFDCFIFGGWGGASSKRHRVLGRANLAAPESNRYSARTRQLVAAVPGFLPPHPSSLCTPKEGEHRDRDREGGGAEKRPHTAPALLGMMLLKLEVVEEEERRRRRRPTRIRTRNGADKQPRQRQRAEPHTTKPCCACDWRGWKSVATQG